MKTIFKSVLLAALMAMSTTAMAAGDRSCDKKGDKVTTCCQKDGKKETKCDSKDKKKANCDKKKANCAKSKQCDKKKDGKQGTCCKAKSGAKNCQGTKK